MTRLLWLGAAAAMVTTAACGESFESGEGGAAPTVPCNEDPWICSPPQSCWIAADYTWQCQSVGTIGEGMNCDTVPGASECGPGLVCLGSGSSSAGTCLPFCDPFDPERGCAVGECTMVRYTILASGQQLPPVHACVDR